MSGLNDFSNDFHWTCRRFKIQSCRKFRVRPDNSLKVFDLCKIKLNLQRRVHDESICVTVFVLSPLHRFLFPHCTVASSRISLGVAVSITQNRLTVCPVFLHISFIFFLLMKQSKDTTTFLRNYFIFHSGVTRQSDARGWP